jgi:hypothetical protein
MGEPTEAAAPSTSTNPIAETSSGAKMDVKQVSRKDTEAKNREAKRNVIE